MEKIKSFNFNIKSVVFKFSKPIHTNLILKKFKTEPKQISYTPARNLN